MVEDEFSSDADRAEIVVALYDGLSKRNTGPIAAALRRPAKQTRAFNQERALQHVAHGRKIAVIGLGYVGLPVAVSFARSGAPVRRLRHRRSVGSRNCAPARTARARSSLPTLSTTGLSLRKRSRGAEGTRFLHRHRADPDRRRQSSGPARAARRVRDGRQGDAEGRDRGLRIHGLSRLHRGRLRAGAGARVGPAARAAISRSAIRPSASIRATRSTASKPSSRWSPGRMQATLDIVADVYGSVVTAGIHRAPSIKVAEAAKVIENTQRDLNIAFMNELVGDLPPARHRHRRRAGRRRHQMEFPEILSGPCRRTLHRRRSVLPDVIAPSAPAIIRR